MTEQEELMQLKNKALSLLSNCEVVECFFKTGIETVEDKALLDAAINDMVLRMQSDWGVEIELQSFRIIDLHPDVSSLPKAVLLTLKSKTKTTTENESTTSN